MLRFSRRFAASLNPRRSLRARFGLAIGIIAFVLSILASLIVGHTTSEQIKVNSGQSLAELAYQMTDKLDRGMFERYRDLQIVSTLNVIRNFSSSVSEQRTLLEKLQSTYPDYAWIGLTDNQGIVQASTGKLLEGKSVSQRPWFINGQKAPYVGDVHEALKLASLLPAPAKEPLRFVDVAVPVMDLQGNPRGVLGAHLSWTWSKEVQKSLLHSLQSRNQEMFILRQDGNQLLGPPGFNAPLQAETSSTKPLSLASVKAAQLGLNSYLIENWSDGHTYLTGFARSSGYRNYPGLGWLVLVRQKTDVAFAPAWRLQKQIFISNLTLGALFSVLGWLVASQLTKPLLAISQAADSIYQGNTMVKIPVLQGRDETANLSKSLNKLVSTLTEHEHDLKASNQQLQLKIRQRQRAELELRSSEERFRATFNSAAVGIAHVAVDGKWLLVNQKLCDIVGYTLEELLSKTVRDITHPEDLDAQSEYVRQMLADEIHTCSVEKRYIRKDASSVWVNLTASLVRESKGEPKYFIAVVEDISSRKQGQEALRQSESRLRLALEVARMGIWDWNILTGQVTWSHNYEMLFGLLPGTFRQTYEASLEYVHPQDRQLVTEAITSCLEQKVCYEHEYRIIWPDGSIHWMAGKGQVFYDETGALRMIGITMDITQRKQAAEQLKASLHEKEVLLKEIHHRVKNNMQVICSLLNLQTSSIEDPQTLELLQEAQNRVASMALVHEQLYQAEDLARIDFAEYTQNLVANLFNSYDISLDGIALKINVDNVFLGVDAAIPCGLIINELVSNSLKYAFSDGQFAQVGEPAHATVLANPHRGSREFAANSGRVPPGKPGEICIEIYAENDNQLALVVSDNGIGFPQELDFRNTDSLGLQIVIALTGQLSGTIGLENNRGTKFKITFPNKNGD